VEATVTVAERRRAFVNSLYQLHYDLASPHQSGAARRQLALFRRSFSGWQAEVEAYDFVLREDPPESEQESWLLVAGLFALHPHGHTAPRRSLGTAMRLLVEERPSARRRFTQLLSQDTHGLPHYLRQAIRLLRTEEIALDYETLLTDLITLRGPRERAHRVRLGWARDFHRPIPSRRRTGGAASNPSGDTADEPHEEES
jgi:CRISPR system Cascade subunit CasB